MNVDQFIAELFAEAKKAGFTDYEAYYSGGSSFQCMVFEGEVSDYSVNSTAGLSFRGLLSGKMGYAYTEALDSDAVRMLVHNARENAGIIENEDKQFIFEGSPEYQKVDVFNPALEEVSAKDKIDMALSLERKAKNADPRIETVGYCLVQSGEGESVIRNSKGLNLSHRDNVLIAFVEPVAKKGDKMVDGTAYRITRDFSEINVDDIVAEAVNKAVSMLDARSMPSGNYKVVFENDAAGDMMATFSGIFSAESTQKDLSLLKGRVGQKIASSAVTLIDDPLMPGGFASSPFDSEGVATYSKNVIDGGTLTTLLHNLKTAEKDGVKSTGNASKSSFKSPVGISPSNFYLKPGDKDIDQLLASVGEGLFVTEVQGLHSGANPVSGDFSLSAKGYRISGGKKAEPVEQVTIAGNFYEMLNDIEQVGNDLKFGLPGSSSIGSPSILVKQLAVAGE